MEIHLYWVSALTYAVVLNIVMYGDRKNAPQFDSLDKSYRLMTRWVIIFCLQDALWGLCEANVIKNDFIFFISSSIFHMSTVLTTFFWLKYVLDYLGESVRHKKLYLSLDVLVICFEFLLVVINCFKITLFKIVDGNYITGPYRPLTFINQYVVYVVIGIITLTHAFRKDRKESANYRTVFLFALAPIVLGICQLLYPDAPFYSLGYFLGCFIVHIFVVAHDREIYLNEEEKMQKILELNHELEKKQSEFDGQYNILQSISGVYDYINLVDFDTKTAYRFDEKDSVVENFDIDKDPHTSLNKNLAPLVNEHHYERFVEFTNLSTLDEKMRGNKHTTDEFQLSDGDWIRAMYIRIGDNVNDPISKVAYALRDITGDRKREEQVYSALTNLVYSLHIFNLEDDTMERLIESDVFKQIVGKEESGQKMANTIIKATCKDEYLEGMLQFVDFSTVSERMQGKSSLSIEFVGKYHGWTRMTFIPIEMNNNKIKKLVVTTEIIDSEKNELMNLVYKSSTDELTRLYNRRMYEEELDAITTNNDMSKLIIMSLDVNGLKTVNDTMGHKAGDELIIGSGKCIKDSLCSVGKVYRTGGDEFMAILRCEKEELTEILEKFDQNIEAWSGNLVKSLSISYGYAATLDYPGVAIRELASEADKNMYESKSAYYVKKGINRRRT